jgi:hypothetical protein
MLDAYSRRARLAPGALCAAPALVLAGGSVAALERSGAVIGFLFAAVMVVLCGLVRGSGRRIEPGLWASWGGAPTTQLLRWSGPISEHSQRRRHALLEALLGESLPSPGDEAADPAGADRRYATATTALRELTRDRARFPLVAEENAEYGFRRNSLGLKPFAISIAASTVLASLVLALINHGLGRFFLPALVAGVAIVCWLIIVRSGWVRSAAERYAERLLESCESLCREEGNRGSARSATKEKESSDG